MERVLPKVAERIELNIWLIDRADDCAEKKLRIIHALRNWNDTRPEGIMLRHLNIP